MKPEARDPAYLWDMREFAREAHRLVRRIEFVRLEKDSMRRLALERTLELVGEAARRVSAKFQSGHPQIDWTPSQDRSGATGWERARRPG